MNLPSSMHIIYPKNVPIGEAWKGLQVHMWLGGPNFEPREALNTEKSSSIPGPGLGTWYGSLEYREAMRTPNWDSPDFPV